MFINNIWVWSSQVFRTFWPAAYCHTFFLNDPPTLMLMMVLTVYSFYYLHDSILFVFPFQEKSFAFSLHNRHGGQSDPQHVVPVMDGTISASQLLWRWWTEGKTSKNALFDYQNQNSESISHNVLFATYQWIDLFRLHRNTIIIYIKLHNISYCHSIYIHNYYEWALCCCKGHWSCDFNSLY